MEKIVLIVFLSVVSLCLSIQVGAAEVSINSTGTAIVHRDQSDTEPNKEASSSTISVMDVPLNTPRLMSSVNKNKEFHSMLYLNQTRYAG
ncbi:hypothetical protein [Enterococcus sp. DIV0840c]|uniref:hypothetical protein n=1 Tax=Enterococcus sp. DIV0840c TaxID=2774772 RepID=UPI003D288EBA